MNRLFKLFLVLVVVLGFGASAFALDAAPAADTAAPAADAVAPAADATVAPAGDAVKAPEYKKGDAVEFSGVVEVTPADEAKGEKFATIVLKVGETSYKLLPSENKDAFNGLEAAAGKTINVKGTFMPADETHPLAALLVTEWAE